MLNRSRTSKVGSVRWNLNGPHVIVAAIMYTWRWGSHHVRMGRYEAAWGDILVSTTLQSMACVELQLACLHPHYLLHSFIPPVVLFHREPNRQVRHSSAWCIRHDDEHMHACTHHDQYKKCIGHDDELRRDAQNHHDVKVEYLSGYGYKVGVGPRIKIKPHTLLATISTCMHAHMVCSARMEWQPSCLRKLLEVQLACIG